MTANGYGSLGLFLMIVGILLSMFAYESRAFVSRKLARVYKESAFLWRAMPYILWIVGISVAVTGLLGMLYADRLTTAM